MVITSILIVIIILFIIYGFLSNFFCRITETKIIFFNKNLGSFDGERIVVLSDLHGNRFGKKNTRLVERIGQCMANRIFVVGDMVVKNGKGMGESLALMEQLVSRYLVYYAPGNHESKLEHKAEYINKLRQLGVVYLDNESVRIHKGKESIRLSGLNLPDECYGKVWSRQKPDCAQIYGLLGEADATDPQILLAHSPDYFPAYEKWGADLVISGHLHGGIFGLPWGGALAPSLRIFPRYVRGLYRRGHSGMYVSRGLGLHHIKLRFFNLPELAVLILKNKSRCEDGAETEKMLAISSKDK